MVSNHKKDIDDKVWACLKEMYARAEPPLDIGNGPEDIIKIYPDSDKHAEVGELDWYQRHVLAEEVYQEIHEKHVKSCRFHSYKKKDFEKTLAMSLLMWSPAFKMKEDE